MSISLSSTTITILNALSFCSNSHDERFISKVLFSNNKNLNKGKK